MNIAQMIKKDFPDRTLSGIGGIDTGDHAAEFILLGSDTVQVCTGVMIHGYPLVQNLCAELQEFMGKHGFESIAEFKGMSLEYFTTHTDLVARQKEAIEKKKKLRLASNPTTSGRAKGSSPKLRVWSATSDDATSPVQRHVVPLCN